MEMKILSLILFALSSYVVINGQMQCRDEKGKVVDWYVVYKFPNLTDKGEPFDTGYRYAFITNNTKNGFTLSYYDINDPEKSIFGQTLSQLLGSKLSADISYIDYNDQPPEQEEYEKLGHTKGVVATDATHGFWLTHSIPQFGSENKTHAYIYPKSGAQWGQTAICISLKISEMSKVVTQLLVMQPNIYSQKISNTLREKVVLSQIKALEEERWPGTQSTIMNLLTVGGISITSFSKSPSDHQDLFAGIVAKTLKTDMYAETWRKNPGNPLKSFCTKPTVENVAEVNVKFENSNITGKFSYLNDHSKWAISKNVALPYVCLGDASRMESQFTRGGGALCIQTPQVWKYISEWIGSVEKCP